jgi:hypothetical protein
MRTFRGGYRILLAKEHEKALLEEEWFLQHMWIFYIKIRAVNKIPLTLSQNEYQFYPNGLG